ncbi:4'-phosphopantetheinyl transferase family protein [Lacrimispora sp. 38-1]|uniref:4'-phosphopantetheinyl transferase family protein n=1 Tax=Lacrimispora sp. 38-1 TaxID=3125778 RepID=UPI003CEF9D10
MNHAYELYILSIENIDSSIVNKFIQYLSPGRQKKARNYRLEADTVRTVCGEMLLRYALSQRSGSSLPEIPLHFTYNPYGKPLLSDYPDVSFNISHSGNWVACAISDSGIGIDVEQISYDIDLNIANHYFHQKEIQIIRTTAAPESYHHFFRFWTAKESYLKCVGKGLGDPLNNFYVSDNTIILEGQITPWHIYFYDTLNNYALSVCSSSSYTEPVLPALVSIENILKCLSINI